MTDDVTELQGQLVRNTGMSSAEALKEARAIIDEKARVVSLRWVDTNLAANPRTLLYPHEHIINIETVIGQGVRIWIETEVKGKETHAEEEGD